MKRIFAMLLAMVCALSGLSGVVFAEAEVDIKEGYLVYNDFETEQSKFGFTDVTGSSNNYQYSVDDSAHNKVLKFTVDGTHHVYSELSEPVTEEGFLLSFDIKLEETDTYIFMRFYSGNEKKANALSHSESFLNFAVKNGGFDYFPGMDSKGNWQVSDKPVKYETGVWNHINIYGDFSTRKIYYYANNELYMTDNMKETFNTVKGFYMTPYDLGTGKRTFYIDNWAFMKTDYENIKPILDKGEEAPDRIKSPVKMSIVDTDFGKNYFNASNLPINLNMKNASKSDIDADAVYRFIDDRGQIVWSKTENVKIAKGEEITKKIIAAPNAFGLMTFNVELKDKVTGNESIYNTGVAVLRAGERNERVHTCLQFHQDAPHRPYAEDILKTLEKAGFAGVRSSIAWDLFEKERGVYKIQEQDEDSVYPEMNAVKATKLDMLLCLKSGNQLYTGRNQIMPSTEAELEAWYNYCYNMVLWTKDYAEYYEVWNEPNLIPNFNPTGVPPEGYAKLLEVAYKAVKAADPTKMVMGVAQSNYGTSFVEAVIKAGGGEYMDAISFHPYMWTQGPEAGQLEFVKAIREMVDSYGLNHLKLYATEVGWQYTVGRDEQPVYLTQMFVLNEVYGGLMDKIWIFRYAEDDIFDGEGFGLMDSIIHENPFMARRHLVATSNFNRLMSNAKFEETKISAESLPLYHFTLQNGRNCIVTWNSAGDKKDLALDLGCNQITVSDIYGTETVYKSDDGKFTLNIDGLIYYIMGDFKKSEEVPKQFSVNKNEIDIVGGSKAEFIVTSHIGDGYEVLAVPSKNLKVEEIKYIGDGKTRVIVSAEKSFDSDESVAVVLKKNGSIYYKKYIDVNCLPSISAQAYVEHHAGNRWRFNVDVTNNMYDGAVGGKVIVESPVKFSKYVPFRNVAPVKGGNTTSVKVPVPDFLGTKDVDFVGKLVMDNGIEIDLSRTLTFKGMPYMRNVPVFDGVISPGEWNKNYILEFEEGKCGIYNSQGQPYSGDEDLRAEMYYGWDRSNFYIAAEIYDDLFEIDPEKNIWAGDSIQFAYSLEKTKAAKRTEITIGIGATTNGPEITRTSGLAPPSDGSRFIHELAIVNYPDEKKTVYELSIPWAEMFPAGFNINDYTQVLFSVLINDRDNNNRETMFEIGSGIGRSKDPSLHLEYNLLK